MKKISQIMFISLIIFSLGIMSVSAAEVTGTLSTGIQSGSMDGVLKAAPTFDPEDGSTFRGSEDIAITAAGSTAICYTTNGSVPACSGSSTCLTGTKYTTAVEITDDAEFKAVGCYADGSTGPVGEATYEKRSSGGGGGGGGSSTVTVRAYDEPLTLLPTQLGTLEQTLSNGVEVYLEVPLGAVNSKTTIVVTETSLDDEGLPNYSDGAILIGGLVLNVEAIDAFGNKVENFNNEVTIVLTIPDMPDDTSNLGVFYFDEDLNDWIAIPGAVFDTDANTVTFKFDHLTNFAIFQSEEIEPPVILPTPEEVQTEREKQMQQILTEAYYVYNHILLGSATIDETKEQMYKEKAGTVLSGFNELEEDYMTAIINFVTYGTESTLHLGEGERLGVINSYLSAFGKLPRTQAEWEDVIKIANGRWPSEESPVALENAKLQFEKVYLRPADMNNPNDNAAVTIMAYGLRSATRNLDSEKAAILIFKGIFKYAPTSAIDWDTVRAIAYSGAVR